MVKCKLWSYTVKSWLFFSVRAFSLHSLSVTNNWGEAFSSGPQQTPNTTAVDTTEVEQLFLYHVLDCAWRIHSRRMNELALLQRMPGLGACKFASIWKVVKTTDTKARADPHSPPLLFHVEARVWIECPFFWCGLVPIDPCSLHSALCLAAVHGWLVASADGLQQLPMCGKAWQRRARPCQSKHAQQQADKTHGGFMGLDLTRAEWMSVS